MDLENFRPKSLNSGDAHRETALNYHHGVMKVV